MFHRISYEEWTTVVPIIAFILTFGAFLVLTTRAVAMRKARREHLAKLPLENEEIRPQSPRNGD